MWLIPLPVLLGVEEVRGDGCQPGTAAAGCFLGSCHHTNHRASPAREMLTRGSPQGSPHLLVAPPARLAHRQGLHTGNGCPEHLLPPWCPPSATPQPPSGLCTAVACDQLSRQHCGCRRLPAPRKASLSKLTCSNCDKQPVLAWLFELAPTPQKDYIFILTRLLWFPRQSNAYKQWN